MTQLILADQKPSTWQRTTLLATDNSHSIIGEIVDGDLKRIAYSAYGEQSAQQEDKTRLGFNGQLREAKIGWYFLGNGYRAYNPRLMRFHRPDSWSPFGWGGLNPYMYCVGDPVNRSDPTGHWPAFLKNLGPGKSRPLILNNMDLSGALGMLGEAANNRITTVSPPATPGGLGEMLYRLGTAHAMPGGSPAISDIGRTTPKPNVGWQDSVLAGAGRSSNSGGRGDPRGIYAGVGGRGRSRSSFDNPRVVYDGPPPREPIVVHEKLLGGAPPSGPPNATTNIGPPGGSYLPIPLRSIPGSPTPSRWSGESGPSDWSSRSSSSSSHSSPPVLATIIRKGDGTSQTRWV